MPDPNEQPLTKQDLIEFQAGLTQESMSSEDRMMAGIRDSLQEMVREVLSAFERYSGPYPPQ